MIEYDGPVRLTPPPMGKRDASTARVLLRHMQEANPALIVPWTLRQPRVERCLQINGASFFKDRLP